MTTAMTVAKDRESLPARGPADGPDVPAAGRTRLRVLSPRERRVGGSGGRAPLGCRRPRPCPRRAGMTRARLTRRGRMALAAAAIAAVVVPSSLAVAARAQAASGGAPPRVVYRSMRKVDVRPGDTLWSIALRVQPRADPRAVVRQVMRVNGLNGVTIQPGEQLWVPRG